MTRRSFDRFGFLALAPAPTLALAVAVAVAFGAPLGCSMKRMVANNVTGTMEDTTRAFYAETYVKHAREAAPSLLVMLDGFIMSAPDNVELLTAAAEMNCSFAMGMAEPEDPRWAARLYQKGRDYGLRALADESERIAAAVAGGPAEDLAQVLREDFDEDDTAALFWTAMCWGSWVNVNLDDMEAIAELPRAETIMTRVLELDETFYHAGPHLFFGMAAASRPQMIGGDPAKGQEHFQRVFELTKKTFLLAYAFYAQSYAVQIQDYSLFDETLRYVEQAPPDIAPDIMLFTAIAKQRAQTLRGRAAELFPGVEGIEAPPSGGTDGELDDLLGE